MANRLELQNAIARKSHEDGFDLENILVVVQTRIDRIVRVSVQETLITSETLTRSEDSLGEFFTLPDDFLQIIRLDPDSPYNIRGRKLYNFPSSLFSLEYYAKLPRLIDDNATNYLLENHFDVYLNACLVELYEELEDELNIAKYESKLNDTLAQVKIVENRAKRSTAKGRIQGRRRGGGSRV